MKKLIYTIFILFSFMIYSEAATTKNGVPITPNSNSSDTDVILSCKYSASYDIGFYKYGKDDTEGETEQGRGIPDGMVPNKGDYLINKGFMTSDGYYDCPKYAIYEIDGNNKVNVIDFANEMKSVQRFFPLIPEKSYCKGACQGEQFVTTNSKDWTCDYTNASGNKIQTRYFDGLYMFYDNPNDQYGYEVEKYDISSTCMDIFYNPYVGEMEEAYFKVVNRNIMATAEITDISELKEWYDLICVDETMIADYYCSGNCRFPENKNVSCKRLKDLINQREENIRKEEEKGLKGICSESGVQKSLRFIGWILMVVKIIVPLLLIVFGCVDFAKATISSESEATNKAIKKLITRLIIGVVIFILPTVINLVFGLFPNKNVYKKCSECIFKPNSCVIEK